MAACSWYVVDPRYQELLSLNPRLEYLEFPAKNVGVRRARGRFVLTSNCDVYFGRRIFEVLAEGTLIDACCIGLRVTTSRCRAERPPIDWSVLEDPRNLAGPAHVLKPPYMGSATGDFVLLDRESFHEIGGFNEVYRVARIGIDRNVLVKALSSGLRIADVGGPVYHENHEGSYRLNPTAYAGRETEAPWGDRRWHSGGVSYVNPPTWGLSEAPVREIGERVWYLDFSGQRCRRWSISGGSCCRWLDPAVPRLATMCESVRRRGTARRRFYFIRSSTCVTPSTADAT